MMEVMVTTTADVLSYIYLFTEGVSTIIYNTVYYFCFSFNWPKEWTTGTGG